VAAKCPGGGGRYKSLAGLTRRCRPGTSDSCGLSAQRTDRNRRSWTTCLSPTDEGVGRVRRVPAQAVDRGHHGHSRTTPQVSRSALDTGEPSRGGGLTRKRSCCVPQTLMLPFRMTAESAWASHQTRLPPDCDTPPVRQRADLTAGQRAQAKVPGQCTFANRPLTPPLRRIGRQQSVRWGGTAHKDHGRGWKAPGADVVHAACGG